MRTQRAGERGERTVVGALAGIAAAAKSYLGPNRLPVEKLGGKKAVVRGF